MADQEETFGHQNSPSGSDSRDLQNDNNKSEKQNGTSSKSPSSQTTYIQQVSIGQSGGSVSLFSARGQAAYYDLWGYTHTKCLNISILLSKEAIEQPCFAKESPLQQ